MKLTNYKRGYFNWCDCSIHGTIYMTAKEWETVRKYYNRLPRVCWPHEMETKTKIYFSLGDTATTKICKKFKIANHRRGNYQIIVSK